MSVVYSGDKITFADSSVQSSAPIGFKNRIINGDCRIDQRNAGASQTISGVASAYIVDRFFAGKDTSSGTFTVQQNQGSVTPPIGFINYAGVTTGTAFTAAAGDGTYLQQRIEGLNIADLNWGTANAKTVTLSFWIYSSLTGTFSGSLTNSAFNYSYPYTYTISSANTWTQISVTIAGPTSGTWLTTNGTGIRVYWNLGSGSNFLGTGGTWTASAKIGTTGSVALSQTAGATFYITGVQLEVGSTASAFEVRDYGRELIMCQRYCQVLARGISSSNQSISTMWYGSNTSAQSVIPLVVSMRSSPTLTATSGTSYYNFYRTGGIDYLDSIALDVSSPNSIAIQNTTDASGTAGQSGIFYIASGNTSTLALAISEL